MQNGLNKMDETFFEIRFFRHSDDGSDFGQIIKTLNPVPDEWKSWESHSQGPGFIAYKLRFEGKYFEAEIVDLLKKVISIREQFELNGVKIHGVELAVIPYLNKNANVGIHLNKEAIELLTKIGKGIEFQIDIDIFNLG
jgi:hypothetical protein